MSVENIERHYTIEELAELVNLSIRTIRYYISEGLLPGPGARGKAALYGEEHLFRLRLIRLLSRQRVPLIEMRERLAYLSISEIRALLAQEEEEASQLNNQGPAPQEYVAKLLKKAREARQAPLPSSPQRTSPPSRESAYPPVQGPARRTRETSLDTPAALPASAAVPMPEPGYWQRWELAPGVELHIRTDSESQHHSLLERLFRAAGKTYPQSNKE